MTGLDNSMSQTHVAKRCLVSENLCKRIGKFKSSLFRRKSDHNAHLSDNQMPVSCSGCHFLTSQSAHGSVLHYPHSAGHS